MEYHAILQHRILENKILHEQILFNGSFGITTFKVTVFYEYVTEKKKLDTLRYIFQWQNFHT